MSADRASHSADACAECGYDLAGLDEAKACPECGSSTTRCGRCARAIDGTPHAAALCAGCLKQLRRWASRVQRHEPRECKECGYDLSGLGPAVACPECGRPSGAMCAWCRRPVPGPAGARRGQDFALCPDCLSAAAARRARIVRQLGRVDRALFTAAVVAAILAFAGIAIVAVLVL